MIYIRCPHCGKRFPRGEKCPCGFTRDYTPATGTRRLYHSERWNKLRAMVMSMYDGVDQYELMKTGRMVPASTVHHIVPAEEDPGLFWSVSNLVPVSRSSHDEIHTTYRAGADLKSQLQDKLRECVHNSHFFD